MSEQDLILDIYREANNAIYFNDSSDYLNSLWNIAQWIRDEYIDALPEEIGESYIK